MDDKSLLAPSRPSLELSAPWLFVAVVAVVVGGLATIVLANAAGNHGSIAPALAVFAVTLVGCVGGMRQAFMGLAPAVRPRGDELVPVIAEVVRVNPSVGMAFGTFTVRFSTPSGAALEGEMLMALSGAVGQRIPARYSPVDPHWVVADGPNIVSAFDLAFKATLIFGMLFLVLSPFV